MELGPPRTGTRTGSAALFVWCGTASARAACGGGAGVKWTAPAARNHYVLLCYFTYVGRRGRARRRTHTLRGRAPISYQLGWRRSGAAEGWVGGRFCDRVEDSAAVRVQSESDPAAWLMIMSAKYQRVSLSLSHRDGCCNVRFVATPYGRHGVLSRASCLE